MGPLILIPADFWSESFPVVDAFQERVRQTGIGTIQIALVAFLVTFLITRGITWSIKHGKGPFGDVSVGGTHIHHLVPGIILLLVTGTVGIAIDWQPGGLAGLIVPTFFGIGAALTLDEFALWLTLKDVYWSKEGRRSVDAVIVLLAVLALAALGIPFWVDIWNNSDITGNWIVGTWHILAAIFCVVTFLKGKWTFAFVGFLFWPLAFIGAVRLARPSSWWARKFYGVRRMTRSEARYPGDHRVPTWFWQRHRKKKQETAAGT
ncbi:MAG: hypothetical protein ACKOGE_04115 [Actinomycetota bacterium]